ncbi:BTB domain-containing protein [Mycena indigotica]|uniref:BTB domain-containing protein n=1 Tax=Mycena indigotica TaxID=2126181 RepID=A0A8H6S2W2_9AGAR|nr:BTB domain-containing protein [Mycena indigotica]KAF7291240.1 BTB domain-containing protein [Mycena indigotica]
MSNDAPVPFSSVSSNDTPLFSYPPDFVLRSSDGFDFHVHRELLRLTSGCFEGMFVVSRSNAGNSNDVDSDPQQRTEDGKPIVTLTEPKSVLYRLLSLAYPVVSINPLSLTRAQDLDNITAVFQAAEKYQFTHIPRVLEQMLDKPQLIALYPYRMFAIARVCNLTALAHKCVLATLNGGAEALNVTFPEMTLLTWDDAHKVNKFHQQCSVLASNCAQSMGRLHLKPEAADNVINCLINPQTGTDYVWWTCKGHNDYCSGKYFGGSSVSSRISTVTKNSAKRASSFFSRGPELVEPHAMWFRSHIKGVQEQLLIRPTDVSIVLALKEEDKSTISSCRLCSKQAQSDLLDLQVVLTQEITNMHGRLARAMFS